MRLTFIKNDLSTVAGFPKKQFSPESVALRLASTLFLAPATAYFPGAGNRPKPTTLAPTTRPLALVRAS
jgi:hypothetical protein